MAPEHRIESAPPVESTFVHVEELHGRIVHGRDGDRIGTVRDVSLDDDGRLVAIRIDDRWMLGPSWHVTAAGLRIDHELVYVDATRSELQLIEKERRRAQYERDGQPASPRARLGVLFGALAATGALLAMGGLLATEIGGAYASQWGRAAVAAALVTMLASAVMGGLIGVAWHRRIDRGRVDEVDAAPGAISVAGMVGTPVAPQPVGPTIVDSRSRAARSTRRPRR
ncbi:MAG: PRC-barrel domain-containing protein [Thermoleophilia bacterium]|nr:PRC-barrel domain-containing protein [Thermoleophilia bacterium]